MDLKRVSPSTLASNFSFGLGKVYCLAGLTSVAIFSHFTIIFCVAKLVFHPYGDIMYLTRTSDGQGGLACCDSWGRNESDMTE